MDSESAESARLTGGAVSVPRKTFRREWWEGLRPHAIQISIDVGWTLLRLVGELAISLLVLLSTSVFHFAGEKVFASGSLGLMIFDFVHLVGSVLALGLFTGLFLHEVWRFSQRHGGNGGS